MLSLVGGKSSLAAHQAYSTLWGTLQYLKRLIFKALLTCAFHISDSRHETESTLFLQTYQAKELLN